MQGDDPIAFFDGGEFPRDFVAFGLKPLNRTGKRCGIDARLNDGIDGPVKFAGNLPLTSFQPASLFAGIACEPSARGGQGRGNGALQFSERLVGPFGVY